MDGEWEYRQVFEEKLRNKSKSAEIGASYVPSRPPPYRSPSQLADAARGVQYLHSLDLAHGDLKGVRFP